MSPLESIKLKEKIYDDILLIAKRHNARMRLDINNLFFNKETIWWQTGAPESFDEILINHHFPSKKGSVRLGHLTTFEKFKKIIDSKLLKLSQIEKRLGEGEMKPFFQRMGFKEDGLKEASKNLYYTSFVDAKDNPPMVWDTFGEQGKGVKLIFSITPLKKDVEVRKIVYEEHVDGKLLLEDLCDSLFDKYNRNLLLNGGTKTATFFLSNLSYEREIRLLIKNFGKGIPVTQTGNQSTIDLPIDEPHSKLCRLHLSAIEITEKRNSREVENVLKASTKFKKIARKIKTIKPHEEPLDS